MPYAVKTNSILTEEKRFRHSGIEAVGNREWGTHFCQFYKTKQDLLDVLVPYFKAGLENNEFCVWVTSDFLTEEDALAAMKKAVPNFSKYLSKKQIEIFPYTKWYVKNGIFDMKRVLSSWVKKHDYALEHGFDGSRVSGNPFWIDNKKDWDDFAAYEAEIEKVIKNYKLLVLCTYSLDKCGASEIIDVVTNHKFALVKRAGNWNLIENSGHQKTEEALRQSEERYHLLFERMTEGFALNEIICDEHGVPCDFVFLDVNPAFERLTGLKASQVLGKRVKEVLPGIEDVWIENYGKVALTGEPAHFDSYSAPLKRHYDTVAFSMKLGQFAVLFLDITERKRAEMEKNDFVAMMSHELRNPLTSIMIGADLARENLEKNFPKEKAGGELAEQINIISQQAKNISRLLDDLLDITRISRGMIQLKLERVNLADCIKRAVRVVQPLVKRQKHTLEVFYPKKPIYLDADPVRIEQMVVNLMNNAAKYTRGGGKIWVRAALAGNRVEISVKDNGIGIPPGMGDSIFNLFARIAKPFTSTQGELGIGLKLTKDLVAMHGGAITVKSEGIDKGCEFVVNLPLAKEIGAAKPARAAAPAKEASGKGKPRVLIVEDNRNIAKLINAALVSSGHESRICHDGKPAIAMAAKFRPQIVFIDIGLPGMSGYELAEKLREVEAKNQGKEKMKLVALTGYGQEEDKKRSRESGFDLHLVKPVSITTLRKTIAELNG